MESKLESEPTEDVCEICGGTGEIEEGEFDDIRVKKCVCQLKDNEDIYEENN